MTTERLRDDRQVRRILARYLTRIFDDYARVDVDETTTEGATKVLASWAIMGSAIDALAGRIPRIPDPPSRAEAADALKQLLFDIPNNLSYEQLNEALELIDLLSRSQKPGPAEPAPQK